MVGASGPTRLFGFLLWGEHETASVKRKLLVRHLNPMAQSAFDRRRVNGPEESFHPIFEDDDEQPAQKVTKRQGRAATDIRPICALLQDLVLRMKMTVIFSCTS